MATFRFPPLLDEEQDAEEAPSLFAKQQQSQSKESSPADDARLQRAKGHSDHALVRQAQEARSREEHLAVTTTMSKLPKVPAPKLSLPSFAQIKAQQQASTNKAESAYVQKVSPQIAKAPSEIPQKPAAKGSAPANRQNVVFALPPGLSCGDAKQNAQIASSPSTTVTRPTTATSAQVQGKKINRLSASDYQPISITHVVPMLTVEENPCLTRHKSVFDSLSGLARHPLVDALARPSDAQDTLAEALKWQSILEMALKDARHEISNLLVGLHAKDTSIQQLKSQKQEATAKANGIIREAMHKLESANNEVIELRSHYKQLVTNYQDLLLTEIQCLRDTKEKCLKTELQFNLVVDESNHFLERSEQTKISVLKELTTAQEAQSGAAELLRAMLETRTGELSEARERIHELEIVAKRYLEDGAQALNTTRIEHKTLQEAITTAQLQLHQSEKALMETQIELREVKKASEILESHFSKEAEDHKSSIQKAQEERVATQVIIAEQKDELIEAEAEVENLSIQVDELNAKVDLLEETNAKYTTLQAEKYQTDIELATKTQLAASNQSKYDQVLTRATRAETQAYNLAAMHGRQAGVIDANELELTRLRIELAENYSRATLLQTELQEAKDEIVSLQRSLQACQMKVSDLQKSNTKLDETGMKLTTEKATLASELQAQAISIAIFESTTRKLQESLDFERQQHAEAVRSLKALETALGEIDTRLGQSQKDYADLQKECSNARDVLTDRNQSLTKQVETLQDTYRESVKTIAAKENAECALKARIETLEANLLRIESKYDSEKTAKIHLQAEKDQLALSLEQSISKNANLQKDVLELTLQATDMSARLQTSAEQVLVHDQLKADLEAASSKLEKAHAQIRGLEANVDYAAKERDPLIVQLQDVDTGHTSTLQSTAHEEVYALNTTIKALQESSELSKQRENCLLSEIATLKSDIEKMTDQNILLAQSIESNSRELDKVLQETRDQLTLEIAQSKTKVVEAKQEGVLQAREVFHKDIAAKDNEIKRLKAKLEASLLNKSNKGRHARTIPQEDDADNCRPDDIEASTEVATRPYHKSAHGQDDDEIAISDEDTNAKANRSIPMKRQVQTVDAANKRRRCSGSPNVDAVASTSRLTRNGVNRRR